eukprot:c40948_g1_i1 orf=72-245(+)
MLSKCLETEQGVLPKLKSDSSRRGFTFCTEQRLLPKRKVVHIEESSHFVRGAIPQAD